jgi:dihydrolipoamide dehydrogenase
MKKHDLIVLGAGPGGYVAAIRAAQLGLDVACVDENEQLGGTCLRVGCIPSKALLESSEKFWEAQHALEAHGIQVRKVQLDLAAMLKRKEQIVQGLTQGIKSLLKKNKVTHYRGRGRLTGVGKLVVTQDDTEQELAADRILIATGSRPATLRGIEWDGKRIVTSTEALAFDEVPKHLVVIGAGYIGLEMSSVWKRLGADVTVLEALDRILPGMDSELADKAQDIFQRQGLEFRLGSRVQSITVKNSRCTITCEEAEPLTCDRVLVAIGRTPNTDDLGLEEVGVELDDRGRIPVDEHYQTNVPGIHAVGDCVPGPMLAHKASEEGVACVEAIVNGHGHVNYLAIPGVVYTHPEIASVGKTEDELKQADVEYRKGVFAFRANGRARTLGDTDGLVKILADKQTDRILGVHILGPRAGDLIAEAVTAIEFGASSEDLARVCHAHPTLAESLKEAALAVSGTALHQ